ncbi:MAG: hypothetical protein IPF55_13320 [Rhodoferax sp.]|nr:hypothetical protein [Rhodoferax sp.]
MLLAAVAVARSDTDIKVISKLHAAVKRDCTAVRTGDLAVATLRELTHAMCRAVAALHWTSPAIEVLSSHSVTWTRACLARSGDPQDKFELTEAIVNQVQIEMWRDKMTSANLLNDEGLKLARELVALAPTPCASECARFCVAPQD